MISVVITTYGDDEWRKLAWDRAYPSALDQGADDIVVHHSVLPIGPARNEAAAKAAGEFLVFLDADDELEPGYLGAMDSAIQGARIPSMTLYQPAVRYVRKGRGPAAVMIPPKDLSVDNYLVIGTGISRELFNTVGGFSNYPHGFEDWSLWAKAWRLGAKILSVHSAVYRAHINPQSAHRTMWRDRRAQVAMHLKVQHELFPEQV